MTKDLAAVNRHIAEARQTARSLSDAIASASDPNDVKDAAQRIRLAREWVKIHGIAQEMHRDLMHLEITCLRRVVELGALDILPSSQRPAAEYFAGLTEQDVAELIAEFHKSTTALGVYRAKLKSDQVDYRRHQGRSYAEGDSRPPLDGDESARRDGRRRYNGDAYGAITALLDMYASDGRNFFIADLADEVLSELPNFSGVDWEEAAVQDGIREVCRKAVSSTKTLKINGTKAPRFVTCQLSDELAERWTRIPFENASLDQLWEMVQLRRHQLAQDKAALDELLALFEQLDDHSTDRSEKLGVIAMRIAQGALDEVAA
jgi:hypothetical protein